MPSSSSVLNKRASKNRRALSHSSLTDCPRLRRTYFKEICGHGFCLNEWIHKSIQKKPIKFLKQLYQPGLGMKQHKMKRLLDLCRQEESWEKFSVTNTGFFFMEKETWFRWWNQEGRTQNTEKYSHSVGLGPDQGTGYMCPAGY